MSDLKLDGSRPGYLALLALGAVLLYALLAAANLWFGDLNQDEGWYLYAARQVAHGYLPYRDFAFTQPPLLPLVYAAAQPMVDCWGVAGGRLFTTLLGLGGACLAAGLAARLAPARYKKQAGILALILLAGNAYQSYYTVMVKTYSLCALFLIAGLLALHVALSRKSLALSFLSGLLLVCASGSRLTAGGALPVVFLYLCWNWKAVGRWSWFAFGLGGAVGLAGIFLPFYLLGREGFLFGVIQYHSLRTAGGLASSLIFKAGFISRLVQAYYLPFCFLAGLLLFRWLIPAREEQSEPPMPRGFCGTLWIVLLLISVVHFMAPFPYEDYEVILYPVFCALLAPALVRAAAARKAEQSVTWLLSLSFLAALAFAFSSPVNQAWFIQGRDRIWWKMKEQPPLVRLRETARWLKNAAQPGDTLLTQDAYLAVESGLQVPSGLEMGPFSYFPEFSRDKAESIHVLNRDMFEELLRTTTARFAALSGYSLSIASPEVMESPRAEQDRWWAIVRDRYEEVRAVPDFGQGFTELRILKLKSAPPTEAP